MMHAVQCNELAGALVTGAAACWQVSRAFSGYLGGYWGQQGRCSMMGTCMTQLPSWAVAVAETAASAIASLPRRGIPAPHSWPPHSMIRIRWSDRSRLAVIF